MDEVAVQQWISNYFKLECSKVLSDDHIVSCAACGSEGTMD